MWDMGSGVLSSGPGSCILDLGIHYTFERIAIIILDDVRNQIQFHMAASNILSSHSKIKPGL